MTDSDISVHGPAFYENDASILDQTADAPRVTIEEAGSTRGPQPDAGSPRGPQSDTGSLRVLQTPRSHQHGATSQEAERTASWGGAGSSIDKETPIKEPNPHKEENALSITVAVSRLPAWNLSWPGMPYISDEWEKAIAKTIIGSGGAALIQKGRLTITDKEDEFTEALSAKLYSAVYAAVASDKDPMVQSTLKRLKCDIGDGLALLAELRRELEFGDLSAIAASQFRSIKLKAGESPEGFLERVQTLWDRAGTRVDETLVIDVLDEQLPEGELRDALNMSRMLHGRFDALAALKVLWTRLRELRSRAEAKGTHFAWRTPTASKQRALVGDEPAGSGAAGRAAGLTDAFSRGYGQGAPRRAPARPFRFSDLGPGSERRPRPATHTERQSAARHARAPPLRARRSRVAPAPSVRATTPARGRATWRRQNRAGA